MIYSPIGADDIHDCVVMIYQPFGLDKKSRIIPDTTFLEVQAGFEPADNGVADRGLTTWLLHQSFAYLSIISKFFRFVKGIFEYF